MRKRLLPMAFFAITIISVTACSSSSYPLTYSNGYVLKEGKVVATYRNGYVSDKEGTIIATYRNGYVLTSQDRIIATYNNGRITPVNTSEQ